jgi:hypothetical protein
MSQYGHSVRIEGLANFKKEQKEDQRQRPVM